MSDHKTTALVTGASSGLGEEYCRQLAQRCPVIIAVARRGERLQALREELAEHCEVHVVEADLLNVEGVAQTMEMLRQKGPVDILVNNAGFSPYGEFAKASIGVQRDLLALHCDATITLCRAAIPFMQELGGGHIVNVSSLGSLMPTPGLAVYGSTKSFLNYFSLTLQQELAGTGIKVQALLPGFVRTENSDALAADGFDISAMPDEMWMSAAEMVTASLAALDGDQVLVVPGENNLAMARAGAQSLLDALGAA